nr:MAG TPA: hypothetical protein [Caudoviricetes sp.]
MPFDCLYYNTVPSQSQGLLENFLKEKSGLATVYKDSVPAQTREVKGLF